ncbi:MAG: hypothetical protein JSU63_19995 [Phycisphaerales bacterium]|nr:MAG: hypothetical protein JSU63_19995 [Phycisphaerales bacterium]
MNDVDSVVALKQAMTRQDIDIAVLTKVREVTEKQGQAVLSLLDAVVEQMGDIFEVSADPHHIDIKV